MKAVMLLSRLEEMGVEGKSFDDVLRSLAANNWDENQVLESFFLEEESEDEEEDNDDDEELRLAMALSMMK